MFTEYPFETIFELIIIGTVPTTSLQLSADTVLFGYAVMAILLLTTGTYSASRLLIPRSSISSLQISSATGSLPKHRYAHSKSASSLTA